jgi:hypothetical protein
MIEQFREALRGHLRACEKRSKKTFPPDAFDLITKLPPILLLQRGDIVDPQLSMQTRLTPDAKATLLRAWQGRWGQGQIETARWDQLDKKERRAAKKFAALLDKQQFFPRQRPNEIDYRIALYLIFTLEGLLGKRLPVSRPTTGGSPRGPAFEALRISIGLAQWRLFGAPFNPPDIYVPKPEALVDLIRLTKPPGFDELMRQQGLSRTPECVISAGETLALTVAHARQLRVERRKT